MNHQNIAKKIENFSTPFKEATKIWRLYYGLPENFNEIKNNSFYAIQYYVGMVHERAGKNPEFPKYHITAIKEVLGKRNFDNVIINDKNFPDNVWRKFEYLTRGKPNKKITEGVVKEILKIMQGEKEPNIIKLLAKKDIDSARKFLRDIRGIGYKLSAFIMRDFYDFFGCWKDDIRNDPYKYYHLQPVDRWVRRISELIWDTNLTGSPDKIAKEIVNHCLRDNVNPVRFNQGAWFVGAYFNYLCSFYNIPIEKRIIDDLGNIIKRFNPNDVSVGIRNYSKYLKNREIFPI